MAKLPWPADPSELPPAVEVVLPTTITLWRVYRLGGDHPTTWDGFRRFGPVATARFDPQPEPAHLDARLGALYAGLSIPGCMAEAFQATRIVDRFRREPWLAGFHLRRPVHLLDLTGLWPTAAGASQAISSGPRPRARAWARAIHAAFPTIDGLWYRSSMHAGDPAVCLWEPAQDALASPPLIHLPLAHPALELPLGRLCGTLGYILR